MRCLGLLLLASCAWSVEVPAVAVSVHDGDTITVEVAGQTERVRLLWIDTPEVTDNSHGKTMPEGERARDLVRAMVPKGARASLWGPGAELERDAYKRLLAVVWVEREGAVGAGGTDAQPATWQENVNLAVIRAGFSPYWRKYGKAPDPMHQTFTEAQESAKEANAGAWATAPDYMREKAGETTAPKR